MKPRTVLGLAATGVAVATLVAAGFELATRFGPGKPLSALILPALAVATALITIGIVDWVRNLDAGTSRIEADDEGEDEVMGAPRFQGAVSGGETQLRSAVHGLERLANEELGAEKTVEEALKAVAGFAQASAVTFWTLDDPNTPRIRARLAGGRFALDPDPAAEPTDPDALRQTAEHRKTLEVLEGEHASFLVPLAGPQRCLGVLQVVVALAGSDEERAVAAQKLGQELSQLGRPFAQAVRAPDLYDQAVGEPLTGLYTKRHFINRLTEATGASRRYGDPLSLILLDVDSFGLINTSYGQATGDRVLQAMGALVQENIREVDSAYRYGPDEVAIILPDTEVDRATVLAERLRRAVRASRTLADGEASVIVTVSVGVAEFDEDMRGIGTLIAHAEEALYAAKTAGRDRIERWRQSAATAEPGAEDAD